MKNDSALTCENCIHADVCKYREEFQDAAKAVLSTQVVMSDSGKGVVSCKPIDTYDWIKVSIGCQMHELKNKFQRV